MVPKCWQAPMCIIHHVGFPPKRVVKSLKFCFGISFGLINLKKEVFIKRPRILFASPNILDASTCPIVDAKELFFMINGLFKHWNAQWHGNVFSKTTFWPPLVQEGLEKYELSYPSGSPCPLKSLVPSCYRASSEHGRQLSYGSDGKGGVPHKGFSINSINVWWSLIIQY